MARFIYHGPPQSLSLKIGMAKDKAGNPVSKFKDFEFRPAGKTEDLPEGNPAVIAMIDAGLLHPVSEPKAVKTKTGEKS